MNQRQWEEIQTERRQLWCEALLVSMSNADPMLHNPGYPEQIADNILAAYDKKFPNSPPPGSRKRRAYKPVQFEFDEAKARGGV